MATRKRVAAPASTSVDDDRNDAWLQSWMTSVTSGASTMSQRKLSSIESRGGLTRARKAAKAHGVHLLLLIDDHGTSLVAASLHAFRVLC